MLVGLAIYQGFFFFFYFTLLCYLSYFSYVYSLQSEAIGELILEADTQWKVQGLASCDTRINVNSFDFKSAFI